MKIRLFTFFLGLTSIEGIAALFFLLRNPSMEKNALLWGYSASRLLLGVGTLLLWMLLVGLFVRACTSPLWAERLYTKIEGTRILVPLLAALTVLMACTSATALIPPLRPEGIWGVVFLRILPFSVWLFLAAAQFLAILLCCRREYLKTALAAGLIALAVFIHLAVLRSILMDERPVIWELHNDTIYRLGRGSDFYALYHASVNIQRGESPYRDAPDGITPYFYSFRYLPAAAQAGQLFLHFSPAVAYRLWVIFLEILLFSLLGLFWKQIAPPGMRCFALIVLLLSSPYFLEIFMGQFTFAMCALMVLGLALRGGGVLLVVSILLKVVPLAVTPALIRQKRHWLTLGVALLVVLAVCVPYFAAHPADWQEFLVDNSRMIGGMDSGNFGLVYLIYRFVQDFQILPGESWLQLAAVLRLVVLGATAFLVFFSRRNYLPLGATALMLAHFISYPHVWEHHISGVIVLGLWMLTIPGRESWFTRGVVTCVLLLALPTAFTFFDQFKDPLVGVTANQWAAWVYYLIPFPKTAGVLGLYLLCLAILGKPAFSQILEKHFWAGENLPA